MTRVTPQPAKSSGQHAGPGQGLLALAAWALSRGLLALLFRRLEYFIDYDVRYYLWQLLDKGLGGALVEYPTPVALLLELLRRVAGSNEDVFLRLFVLLMVLIDGIVAVWLWRSYSRRAAAYWSIYIFAVGPLAWYRIDLLPAVAVLAGLVWLTRRPVASGVAVALGAATKLWPAMLIAPMLGTDRSARRRLLGFGVAGGALGLASLLLFGWQRSIAPLTWQSDRGLQIESIAATWAMLRFTFGPSHLYRTELSRYNAWEIYGPGVDAALAVTDWLLAGTILLTLVFGWLIAFNGVGLPGRRLAGPGDPDAVARRTHAIVLAQVALICAVIVANKTFSPQYMIWLGGPLAVLVALPLRRRDRTPARWLAALGLACAIGTHLVFPLNYGGLISTPPRGPETVLLVGRNLLMLVFTTASVLLALRAAAAVGVPRDARRA